MLNEPKAYRSRASAATGVAKPIRVTTGPIPAVITNGGVAPSIVCNTGPIPAVVPTGGVAPPIRVATDVSTRITTRKSRRREKDEGNEKKFLHLRPIKDE